MIKVKEHVVKHILVLLTILVLCGTNTIDTFAANPAINFVVNETEVEAGDIVKVDVEITGNTGIIGANIYYSYNEDVLEYNPQINEAANTGLLGGVFMQSSGALLWDNTLAVEGDSDNGIIATLIFTVLEDATMGDVGFEFTMIDCIDANLESVLFDAEGASIKIVETNCEHEWDKGKIVIEPTCGQLGEKKYTCSVCNDIKFEAIARTGTHVLDENKGCILCGMSEIEIEENSLGADGLTETEQKEESSDEENKIEEKKSDNTIFWTIMGIIGALCIILIVAIIKKMPKKKSYM